MVYGILTIRRIFCQDTLDLIKAKSGARNCPARKSRKREGNDDCIKGTAPQQTPKGSRRKKRLATP
jgi:hypothetical protein